MLDKKFKIQTNPINADFDQTIIVTYAASADNGDFGSIFQISIIRSCSIHNLIY